MSVRSKTDAFESLRWEAERILSSNDIGDQKAAYSKKQIAELLHEIQVQQIELEMQNDELRRSNNELELQRAKFAGLYDLAPVGYFILDAFGVIKEVNDTGAEMLGIPKDGIIGKPLQSFVIKEEEEMFSGFLVSIQINEKRESCAMTMIRAGQRFYAQMGGFVPSEENPGRIRCYIAVIDITDRKIAEAIHEKHILTATIQTQENERKRVSEALHDSVGQLLYGIKLRLDQQTRTDGLYKDMHNLLDQAIQETRNISFELAPSILKDFGLRITLDEMAKRLATKHLSIQVNVDIRDRLELNFEVTIFRVIQELVNNSIKHALASKITIVVRREDRITIEVSDNGIGFAKNNQKTVTGSGLTSIRNRISLYGGEMFIDSIAGKGQRTLVTLTEKKDKD